MMGLNGVDVKPMEGIRCSRTKTARTPTQADRHTRGPPSRLRWKWAFWPFHSPPVDEPRLVGDLCNCGSRIWMPIN